jgi:hypothetical protein
VLASAGYANTIPLKFISKGGSVNRYETYVKLAIVKNKVEKRMVVKKIVK